jgi:hypothetical protein
VKAVAGRCGLIRGFRDFDYGIDLTLHEVAIRTSQKTQRKRYIESGAVLDIQIKSTTRATVQSEAIVYDLEADAYNDLCDPNVRSPRIPVLQGLPEIREKQLEQTEQRLSLGGCSYWPIP